MPLLPNQTVENPVPISLDPSNERGAKFTTWAKEPVINDLKNDFEMAKQHHDMMVTKIDHWNNLMSVQGNAKPKPANGRSSVQPKLIRRQAEWRYSALTEPFLGSNKLFSVKPTTFEDENAAKQNELLLNWQFRTKLNRVKFIDEFVRTTVDEGTCIVRVGWKRVTTTVQEQVPEFNHYEISSQEEADAFKASLEASQENPRGFDEQATPEMKAAVEYYNETQQATVAEIKGYTTVSTVVPIENQPELEIINYKNFYIDPTCNGDVDKALFSCISFETNKSELEKNPERYKNLHLVNWEGNTPLTQPDHESQTPDTFQFRDTARKKVVAYEYWGYYDVDGTGELKPIVCTWIGNVIIRMEENPFPDQKLPFVIVPYLPVKRSVYGEPDAELLEDNQRIIGALTRGMIDLLGRSANSQQGFAKGMLDPLNRRRYERGEDYEFNPNQNPDNGIITHKYPELPQSALLMLNVQNQEAEALTGVKSFSGGLSGEAYGDVAAGIRGVLDAASKREMAILRRLAKGITLIGSKIIAMNAVFLSKKETIRITNQQFEEIKREDLKGNFDLEVDISTAEVDNAKSQDLAFMLQTIGPKADWGLVALILSEIAELKRMPALAHKIKNYAPQPSPEQIEMQRLQIEEQQLKNEELRSRIALNEAKAEEANANTRSTDLDTVENETGVKHARDMQKQQGQSRGNQSLEITKALVKPRKEGESKPDIEAGIGFNEMSEQLNKMN